jgi:uncharacterized protein YciI
VLTVLSEPVATVPGMSDRYFLVEFTNGPAWDPSKPRREQAGWDAHAAFMDELTATGFVVIGGPVGEGEGDGALLVVAADDAAAARERLAADPWLPGVLALQSVRAWTVWLRAEST